MKKCYLILFFILMIPLCGLAHATTSDSVTSAVGWLLANQKQDGSWGGSDDIKLLHTSEVVTTLRELNQRMSAYYWGIAWIENHDAPNTDYIARRIIALTDHGDNVQADLVRLQTWQKQLETGKTFWGLTEEYQGTPLDTALALSAFSKMGIGLSSTSPVLNYLKNIQSATTTDNGWSIAYETTNDPMVTALVLNALVNYQGQDSSLAAKISNGVAWLRGKLDTNTSPKSLLALAAITIQRTGGNTDNLLNALVTSQSTNGSWSDDPYTTALAARALAASLGSNVTNPFDIVTMPDQNLRAAVNAALGKNKMDNLTKGDMARLTELNANGMGIVNLTGMEWAINLRSADFRNNNIASTTPLNGLINLTLRTGNSASASAYVKSYSITGDLQADALDLNIYGSADQKSYWSVAARNYLDRTLGGPGGCDAAPVARTYGAHYIVKGNNCTLVNGAILIRFTEKDSWDGIAAVKGMGGDGTCSGNYREMLSGTESNATACYPVTLGAADVPGEALVQRTNGMSQGPFGGVWQQINLNGIAGDGMNDYKPLVIPDGFFVNEAVQVRTCTGGTGNGSICANTDDCPGGTCGELAPLDRITQQMAGLIFSGKAYNWRDFGVAYPNLPITACMRHAGAGSHAVLDSGVIKNNGLGQGPAEYENPYHPGIWFNISPTDMMNCINGIEGAIGYAVADETNLSSTFGPLKYNGFLPTRENIKNGQYASFRTDMHLYENPGDAAYDRTHSVVQSLMNYIADPAHMPAAQADFWAAESEMPESN